MKKILVYTPKINQRIQYIFEFILKEFSGLNFELTSNIQFFEASDNYKLSYAPEKINEEIHLKSDEFMFEKGIFEGVNFDELHPVGQCFYALSRYEEYFQQELDTHQRISGIDKVYRTPFVDEWILKFQSELKSKFPLLEFKKREFKLVVTVDIDQAWKYKHKGFKRIYGGYIRDVIQMNFRIFSERRDVISGKMKDPYDTYDYFKSLKEKHNVEMIFFWLMGDYSAFDKNCPVNNPDFQRKIKEVSNWAEIGIHPSYVSNAKPNKLKLEINRLSKIINRRIQKSRQHYIKLNLPTTYRRLIEEGIIEDHTMAYADVTGFRAGTATPFYWFDLENDEKTTLKVRPFCAMDVSLRNYMKLSVDEAKLEMNRLKTAVQNVNGEMIILTHNSNLVDEWEPWIEVLESVF